MIVLNGKHNHAKIMIDHVDEATQTQIMGFLGHPAFGDGKPIVIMPDCHAGIGAVVGFTMPVGEHVIPNIIGVDLGCGVNAYNLGPMGVDFPKFDAFIRANIPSGKNVRDRESSLGGTLDENLQDNLYRVCTEIEENHPRTLYSVGTLGGGNHFIELAHDSKENIWLVIHSGSRHFGLAVAQYHQAKAKELMVKMFHGASAYHGLEFLPMDLGGREYLRDMHVAMQFAEANRWAMAEKIVQFYFGKYMYEVPCVCSMHNFVGRDGIIRKGAISAHVDEEVIIPLNMRDGSIIGVGRGNVKWNCSAPHGAGRLMSRRKAKDNLDLAEFAKEMTGIWSSCVSEKTLDEAPMAYKDAGDILDVISDTVEVTEFLEPIYNFKAS